MKDERQQNGQVVTQVGTSPQVARDIFDQVTPEQLASLLDNLIDRVNIHNVNFTLLLPKCLHRDHPDLFDDQI